MFGTQLNPLLKTALSLNVKRAVCGARGGWGTGVEGVEVMGYRLETFEGV